MLGIQSNQVSTLCSASCAGDRAELCEIVGQLACMGQSAACSDQIVSRASQLSLEIKTNETRLTMPDQDSLIEWACCSEQEPKILLNLHKHQTILSISDGARILLGYNDGDLVGRPLRSIQGPLTEQKKLVALIESIRCPSSCHSARLVFYGQDAREVDRIVRASATTFRGLPACIFHLLPCPSGALATPPPPIAQQPVPAATKPACAAARHLEAIQELEPEVRIRYLRRTARPPCIPPSQPANLRQRLARRTRSGFRAGCHAFDRPRPATRRTEAHRACAQARIRARRRRPDQPLWGAARAGTGAVPVQKQWPPRTHRRTRQMARSPSARAARTSARRRLRPPRARVAPRAAAP